MNTDCSRPLLNYTGAHARLLEILISAECV